MKTTIDNNQKVFQIVDSFLNSTFCNLCDLQAVLSEINDFCKVYYFWNSKQTKISPSELRKMLTANQIKINKNVFYNLH